MSCFTANTCQANQIFYRINCDFTIQYTRYVCNPLYTCQRDDGLYDCCVSNIADCIINKITFDLSPTISPTIEPNIDSACELTCDLAPSTNQCYWYESQNMDISCIDKNNKYCCSHNREECCYTHVIYAYVIFGSLFCLCIMCAYYKYIVCEYTRVSPDKSIPDVGIGV
jgi:hypothetical protein